MQPLSKQIMCGAVIDGPALQKNNEHRWPVCLGSQQIGVMTSAVHSPRLDQNIGFALIERAHLDQNGLGEDTGFTVQTAEGVRALSVTTMPFIDPQKTIPRQSLRDLV